MRSRHLVIPPSPEAQPGRAKNAPPEPSYNLKQTWDQVSSQLATFDLSKNTTRTRKPILSTISMQDTTEQRRITHAQRHSCTRDHGRLFVMHAHACTPTTQSRIAIGVYLSSLPSPRPATGPSAKAPVFLGCVALHCPCWALPSNQGLHPPWSHTCRIPRLLYGLLQLETFGAEVSSASAGVPGPVIQSYPGRPETPGGARLGIRLIEPCVNQFGMSTSANGCCRGLNTRPSAANARYMGPLRLLV